MEKRGPLVILLVRIFLFIRMYHQPPPPPPVTVTNPMDYHIEWYIDIPTLALEVVLGKVEVAGPKFSTTTALVAGGDQVSRWARICIAGKPIGIHYTIADIASITNVSEVGQQFDTPFPAGIEAPIDEDKDLVPVFHAAWSEFNLRNQQR